MKNDPSESEQISINRAILAIESVSDAMGKEPLAEFQMASIRILAGFMMDDPKDPFASLRASALTARQTYRGIIKKRGIGEDNDVFHKDDMFVDEAQAAYEFGQKLVRWNRLLELRFLDRMLKRKGPLSDQPLDEVCLAAIAAADAWSERED